VVVYLYVSDADAVRAEWASCGVEGHLGEIRNADYGIREFGCVDRHPRPIRGYSQLTRKSLFALDCVVADAVRVEPVSAENSLLSGKITGKFAELASLG
jgi:hypothetical protein